MRHSLLKAGICLVITCMPLQAQDPDMRYFVVDEMLARAADDPTLRSSLAVPQPKLIIEASKDGETKIKARFGAAVKDDWLLDVEVVSPIDKATQRATLADLDGLAGASTADFGLSYLIWKVTDEEVVDECGSSSKRALTGYSSAASKRRIAAAMAAEMDTATYQEILGGARKLQKKSWPVFLTGRFKIAQQDFSFVNPPTLEAKKESHTGEQGTVAIGTFVNGAFYSSLSYSWGTRFAAGEQAEICSPFNPAPGSLRCRTVTLGPPNRKSSETAEVEIRRLFTNVGFALRATRDLQADETVIELPIYSLQKLGSKGMEMNAGIAISWRSDTDTYSVSAFIGPALSSVFRFHRE